MLPIGVRCRQLSVRTLLAGMCLTQADGRPAHLTRVHQALTSLPEDDQRRLGVIADWKNGPHRLTYRQTEYTFGLVADALARDEPGGLPSPALQAICDTCWRPASRRSSRTPARRWPWTGRTWSPSPGPRPAKGGPCADPEASWGHRKNNLLRSEDELFYGYYLSARDHDARRERPGCPRARPPHHPVVLPPRPGPRLGPRPDGDARTRDPARRHPRRFRLRPPRRRSLGHPAARRRRQPSSRTCTRTTAAPRAPTTAPSSATATSTAPAPRARCWNSGRSPAAPPPKQAAAHDARTAELARYKLGRLTA